jgi:hypothetical protein
LNAYLNILQRFIKTCIEYEAIRNETVIDAKIHSSFIILYYFNSGYVILKIIMKVKKTR